MGGPPVGIKISTSRLSIANQFVRNSGFDASASTNRQRAEVTALSQQGEVPGMYVGYNGLWGLLVLAGDIWAVINIVQSAASNERKLIWILVVLLLPLLGLILWYFLGPRDGRI